MERNENESREALFRKKRNPLPAELHLIDEHQIFIFLQEYGEGERDRREKCR